MITKVEIENFQSHKKTVVEFVPGTNVIIGESDAGKSALFRAINWVISNRPLGDHYRSDWGGDTRVILHTSEGNKIERSRSASKNEYIVNGKPLTAFGAEVPEDVINILQMDSANIREQFAPYFLLSATPGEAARMLNKAASIDDIDHTVAGLRRSYSGIDGDIKHNQKQLAEYNEQMERYADIPVIEKRLNAVEELDREFLQRRKNCSALASLWIKAIEIREALEKTKHIPDLLRKCGETEKQFRAYQERGSRYRKLAGIVARARELEGMIKASEHIEEAMPILGKAEELFTTWKERGRSLEQLRQLVSRGRRISISLDRVQKTIERMDEEYHQLAPEICPLCGNRMVAGK